jgi:hypothetical protein
MRFKVGPVLQMAAVVALTACSAGEAGAPSPTTESTQNGSPPPKDVPVVENPLDPTEYLDHPCDLLPESFIKEHDLRSPGDPHDRAQIELAGPGCGWKPNSTGGAIQIIIETANRDAGTGGLQGSYDAFQRGQFDYWDPTSVSHYPAALPQISDDRDRGECNLVVGIADAGCGAGQWLR